LRYQHSAFCYRWLWLAACWRQRQWAESNQQEQH
jgi:hypothetical protein